MNTGLQRIKILILILIIPFILFSCTTTLAVKGIPGYEEFIPPKHFRPEWKNVSKGIEIMVYHQSIPPFTITALKVDLSVPERDVIISKGEKVFTSAVAGEDNFKSKNIKQFINNNHLIAAINATPFRPYRFFMGKPQTAVGIVMSNGTVYSKNTNMMHFLYQKIREYDSCILPLKILKVIKVQLEVFL